MKQTIIDCLIARLLFHCGFAGDEWKPLFNGKSFTGWSFDTLDKAGARNNLVGQGRDDCRYRERQTQRVYAHRKMLFQLRRSSSSGAG